MPSEISGVGEIVQCQVKKEALAGFPPGKFLADRPIVGGTVLEGMLKDG